jgi:hypothetical protein
MKVCSKCSVNKNLDCFPVRKDRGNGVRNICIECFNAATRERNAKRRDCINERQRKYYETNKEKFSEYGKKYREKLAEDRLESDKEYRRKWYLENREHALEQRKEQQVRILKWQKEYYEKRDRQKLNANKMVSDAVIKGNLIRPKQCSICGSDKYKIQGHHEDYSKPLEVIWVCTYCHSAIHKSLKEREADGSKRTKKKDKES